MVSVPLPVLIVQVPVPALKLEDTGVPTKLTLLSVALSAASVSAVAPPVPVITFPVVVLLRPTLSVSALALGPVSVSAIETVVQAEAPVPSDARYTKVSVSGVASLWMRAGAA
jgi:hypothetical protein